MKLYRDFTTQEELDREYNAVAAVPEAETILRRWQMESAKVLERYRPRLGVAYGPTRFERLDVFPAGPGTPLHLFFHGGYWRRFRARDFAFLAPAFVDAGVTFVGVDYALCPEVRIGEIVRQVRAAVAWVWRHAAEFGADPARITLSGHSAGGHLVAMALATDWPGVYELPGDLIKGALAISGIFDLAPLRWTFLQPALQLDEEEIARSSPIRQLPERAPPLVVAVGAKETAEFRRQSRAYWEAWRARGLSGALLEVAGCDHFTVLEELARPGGALWAEAMAQLGGERS